jgi:hypothetical protein
MDRTYGGLQILPPFENHDKDKNKDKDKKGGGKSIFIIRRKTFSNRDED